MRVLFLVPPDTMSIESSIPKRLESGKGLYPKLGLLYVASYLEAQGVCDIELIDAPAKGMSYEMLASAISRAAPDLVAMSVLTFNLLDAIKTARLVKEIKPSTQVCLGGAACYPLSTGNAESSRRGLRGPW